MRKSHKEITRKSKWLRNSTLKVFFENIGDVNLTIQRARPMSDSEFFLGLRVKSIPAREKYIIDEQCLSEGRTQRYKGEPDAWLKTDT
jgi:hypothetical protein